jgi:hypothetical protein
VIPDVLRPKGRPKEATMPTRTISKLITTTAAVSALGLAASGSALARPSSEDCACARVTQTTATAHPVPTPPTWPQNPVALAQPQTVAATGDSGFQWDDAGIGAGGALVVVLAGLGGVVAFRRRHEADPPLPA